MKRILTALLVLAMLMSCALAEGTLKVGMECDYAPYNWKQADPTENGVPLSDGSYADGYDVRIAKRIAEALDMELEVHPIEWAGLVPALTSGEIDCIIAGMSPTEERKATIDFTDVYYESELTVVVKKDGPFANATSLEDLTGAKVVGQLATFHDSVIDQIPEVEHLPAMAGFPEMIAALSAGTVDGYVSEIPGAQSAVATNPELTYITFDEGKGFEYSPDDANIAIGVKKDSDLTAKINDVLATITIDERNEIMRGALADQPSAQ